MKFQMVSRYWGSSRAYLEVSEAFEGVSGGLTENLRDLRGAQGVSGRSRGSQGRSRGSQVCSMGFHALPRGLRGAPEGLFNGVTGCPSNKTQIVRELVDE